MLYCVYFQIQHGHAEDTPPGPSDVVLCAQDVTNLTSKKSDVIATSDTVQVFSDNYTVLFTKLLVNNCIILLILYFSIL